VLEKHFIIFRYSVWINFAIAVFDNNAFFNARNGKGFGFYFGSVSLGDLSVKNIIFIYFNDCAVGFNNSGFNIFDLDTLDVWNINFALLFASVFRENFDPDVMLLG
jgi:hypothetical protein